MYEDAVEDDDFIIDFGQDIFDDLHVLDFGK